MAKILLVEDDNNLREIYEARLVAEGYEIVSARDGEEALSVAMKEKPNLIISDVMMPKISGFDMLDILRTTEETKHVKIIMMTALSQAEDKARAEKLGADRYLVKSQVTLEDVAKVAKEVLEETASPAIVPAPAPAAASIVTSGDSLPTAEEAPLTVAPTALTPPDEPVVSAPVDPAPANDPAPADPAPLASPDPVVASPAPEPSADPTTATDPAATTPDPAPATPTADPALESMLGRGSMPTMTTPVPAPVEPSQPPAVTPIPINFADSTEPPAAVTTDLNQNTEQTETAVEASSVPSEQPSTIITPTQPAPTSLATDTESSVGSDAETLPSPHVQNSPVAAEESSVQTDIAMPVAEPASSVETPPAPAEPVSLPRPMEEAQEPPPAPTTQPAQPQSTIDPNSIAL